MLFIRIVDKLVAGCWLTATHCWNGYSETSTLFALHHIGFYIDGCGEFGEFSPLIFSCPHYSCMLVRPTNSADMGAVSYGLIGICYRPH